LVLRAGLDFGRTDSLRHLPRGKSRQKQLNAAATARIQEAFSRATAALTKTDGSPLAARELNWFRWAARAATDSK
jgi:hypothetical protein